MKTKDKRKFLALLLSLVFCLAMLPGSLLIADDGTGEVEKAVAEEPELADPVVEDPAKAEEAGDLPLLPEEYEEPSTADSAEDNQTEVETPLNPENPLGQEEDKLLLAEEGFEYEEIPANPDNLAGPEEGDGTLDYSFNFASRSALRSSSFEREGEDDNVELSKIAEPVEGFVNKWKVTLSIKTKEIVNKVDTVLVVDTSGSMKGNRMAKAKAAANTFVNTVLATEESKRANRIAIVDFSSGVKIAADLTNNPDTLNKAINALNADGGTFTQAGLKQAAEILKASDASVKNIVLLSDGEPTYSYAIEEAYRNDVNNLDVFVTFFDLKYYETRATVPQEKFIYTTAVGDGTDLRTRYNFLRRLYYNHGNSAIAEAAFFKDSGGKIYSIAMNAGTVGTPILRQIATTGEFHDKTPEELEAVFETIAGDVLAAMKTATVSDPMGQGFEIPAGEIENIDPKDEVSYDADNRILTWTPVKFVETGEPNVKEAKLTYTIVVNDDILNINPVPEDGYSANGEAKLTYTDANGEEKTKEFPVPKLKPVLLTVEKVLKDCSGQVIDKTQNGETFNITVNGVKGEDNVYNKTYSLQAGDKKVLVDVLYEATYTVSEQSLTNYEDPKITINGEEKASFELGKMPGDEPQDGDAQPQEIILTNQEKAACKITVKKELLDNEPPIERQTRAPIEFEFKLSKKDGEGNFVQIGESFKLTAGNSKTIEELCYGEYKVEEIDTQGYTASYSPEGGLVTLSRDNKEAVVTVSNSFKGMDVTVKKVWVDGPKAETTIELYRKSEKEDETKVGEFKTEKGKNTEHVFKGLAKHDKYGNPFTYSVKEPELAKGYSVKIEANESKDVFTVTNTYEIPKDASFTAKKVYNTANKPEGIEAKDVLLPELKFTLWRKTKSGTDDVDEEVLNVEAKTINKDTLTAEWTELEATDIKGREYSFYVKESFADPDDPYNDNWEFGEYNPELPGFTNSLKKASASLTVIKVLENEASEAPMERSSHSATKKEQLVFKFKLTDPLGKEIEFDLKAGEQKEFKELLFGDYTLEELEDHGYTPTYMNSDGEESNILSLSSDKPNGTITVTNKNIIEDGNENLLKITVNKKWVNGPMPRTKIELWRKGVRVTDGAEEEFDEIVDSFYAHGKKTSHEFVNLAKHDTTGREFEYFAKEPNVPKNYKVTYSEDKLTVTNTYTAAPPPPSSGDDPVVILPIPKYPFISMPGVKISVPAQTVKSVPKQVPVTGDGSGSLYIYASLMLVLAAALAIVKKKV